MAVNDIVMGAAGASGPATYIEDVFSTWLYTGNGSTQTITNGIDLSGKGGLTWFKARTAAQSHVLIDSARGTNKAIFSNETRAQVTESWSVTYNSNGMTLPGSAADPTNGIVNFNNYVMTSWTFRKQPKFFDIVTYTGDGTSNKVINHSLGSTPGFIVVKRTDSTGDWGCWHNTFTPKQTIFLNQTTAVQTYPSATDITVNATSFTIGTNQIFGNSSGATYVAYLFAHNAGGFGATGTDNVISCGSVTSDSNRDVDVSLGYEPQWVLFKSVNRTGDWAIVDSMRKFLAATTNTDQPGASTLNANTTAAESNDQAMGVYATGFKQGRLAVAGDTYIYIAIRRPMKTPTTGTEVFAPITRTGTRANATINSIGFTPDAIISTNRPQNTDRGVRDRLRGSSASLYTNSTRAEEVDTTAVTSFAAMNGILIGADNSSGRNTINYSLDGYINWIFKRAAGFFDVVCYTGTDVGTSPNHNLGVIPELKIIKNRSTAVFWPVGGSIVSGVGGRADYLELNTSNPTNINSTYWWTADTSTIFSVRAGNAASDTLGDNYVAYLFATVAGVSKVFSFTGNGSSQTINCSFTTGARFILIKRTDSAGDWYVWDSARGIVSGNDPHLSLNTTDAEVTTDDTIDPDSSGFIVNQVSATNVNVNAATYIGLAIA